MFYSRTTKRFAHVVLTVSSLLLGFQQLLAQEREEVEERIEILVDDSAEASHQGARENREEVHRELEIVGFPLGDREHELREVEVSGRRDEGPRGRYLRQIFAAVSALRELGRHEDARRLEQIGIQLRRQTDAEPQRVIRRRIVRRDNGDVEQREEERVDRDRQREALRERERGERGERERGEREHGERERGERERGERERGAREPEDGQREREGDRRDRENPELRAARQQLRIFGMAIEALQIAGREDAAGQLGQVAESLEAAIEGRHDQAHRLRERGPSRGQQAELLMLASRFLREGGKEESANAVRQLAQQLAGREQRPRMRPREGELGGLQERVRRLANELEELQRHLEHLRGE